MTDTDRAIAEIRAALDAGPTPGRRFQGRSPHSYCVYDKRCWYEADGSRHGETPNLVVTISPEDAQADAQFIAAASPDNIRALLDRLDAADAENERLRDEVFALNRENEILQEDVDRYRWLKSHLLCADFEYDGGDYQAETVIVFRWPKDAWISNDLSSAIDAARREK